MAKLVRQGEWNTSGAIRYRSVGANTGIEFGLDYDKAPVPEHYYVADYLHVNEDDGQIMFTFGKRDKPVASRLRSKVEVYFNPAMFVRQYWASSREFHNALRRYVDATGLSKVQPSELLEAQKVQTFYSNAVLMLQTEAECLLDFFYLSPKDIVYRPQKGEKMDVEALIRVISSPNQILSLLDQSQPIAEKLLPKYGEPYANLELQRPG